MHARISALLPVALAVAAFGSACGNGDSNVRQGYIEAEFVYVSSPYAGRLEKLAVQRGASVKAGDPLFTLEDTPEKAAREETERRRAQALASFKDLKRGRRPSEIDAVRAQVKQAQAALDLAQKELQRQERLIKTPGATTPQDLDRARALRDQERERVTQL